jgi:FixJ family two-component response regulator
MVDRCPACGFPLSETGAPLTLSPEAQAVLRRLCAGRRAHEIAADLHLPPATVYQALHRLRAATASRTTAQMVARPVRCGLGKVNVPHTGTSL